MMMSILVIATAADEDYYDNDNDDDNHDNELMATTIIKITRSIQRTQPPPRLRHLTLTCDLDLTSRSRKLMSLDVVYCIGPWFQV